MFWLKCLEPNWQTFSFAHPTHALANRARTSLRFISLKISGFDLGEWEVMPIRGAIRWSRSDRWKASLPLHPSGVSVLGFRIMQ